MWLTMKNPRLPSAVGKSDEIIPLSSGVLQVKLATVNQAVDYRFSN
jgi:hypothetical protein